MAGSYTGRLPRRGCGRSGPRRPAGREGRPAAPPPLRRSGWRGRLLGEPLGAGEEAAEAERAGEGQGAGA